jgi:hypothetical protein
MRSRLVYVGPERCRSSSFIAQITSGPRHELISGSATNGTTSSPIWSSLEKPCPVVVSTHISVSGGADDSLPRFMCHGKQGDHAHHQARRARIDIRRVSPPSTSKVKG